MNLFGKGAEFVLHNNRNESAVTLERVRRTRGADALRAYFEKIVRQDKEEAAALLNHEGIKFTTLYLLIPQLDAYGIFPGLSERNRAAVTLCAVTLAHCPVPPEYRSAYLDGSELNHAVCGWIFRTGAPDDGLDDEFDRMLDVAAARLIRVYRDSSIHPELTRLIFRRNRQGKYIHDLVWALLSSGEPALLTVVAEYLRSEDKSDAALASKLLRNIPDETEEIHNAERPPYSQYRGWLRENMPYLYCTGETFHQTSEPSPFKVDVRAKYLCSTAELPHQRALEAFSEQNGGRLESFGGLSKADQTLLAGYSNRLHSRDIARWKKFMQVTVEEQMAQARGERGRNRGR